MDCSIGYHIISQYMKLALVQASVSDRNVQGTRFPLIPSTPCFNAISRKRKVKKFNSIYLVVAEAMVMIRGHIPHTSSSKQKNAISLCPQKQCLQMPAQDLTIPLLQL